MELPNMLQRWLLASMVLPGLLATRGAVAQERVVISEFAAVNARSVADRDRDYSDWIELYNAGPSAVNLNGWCLTDSQKNLQKWKFPAVSIGSGEFLVVFASKKDRRAPGVELHTNFKLDADGGYLALVKPDGKTVASEFAPEYPRQVAGASYGVPMAERPAPVFDSSAPRKVLVPAGDIGLAWTGAAFDDSKWQTVAGPVGFGSASGEWNLQSEMQGKSASAYVRIPFEIKPGELEALRLKMRANDGFVAYLNGREVARANAPERPVWNSTASGRQNANEPVSLVATFEPNSAGYASSQTDPSARPRTYWLDSSNTNAFLRLLDARQSDQVQSIAFPQVAPGAFDAVNATFDFRWRAGGSGTERFTVMLIPVAQYGVSGSGADLSLLRDQKDPKYPGVFAIHWLHDPQDNDKAVVVYWDRTRRFSRDVPSGLLGQGQFHQASIRLKHTPQGALFSMDLVSDVNGQRKQTFNVATDVLIPGLLPFQSRVQLAARAGDRDQTVDIDNLRVDFFRENGGTLHEFDLSRESKSLRPGRNILAIHGLNHSATDGSFQIEPELIAAYAPSQSSEPCYFPVPTPRAENRGGLKNLSPPPILSRRSGVHSEPVTIELSSAAGVVRYTLDGSEPNLNSAVYSEPIRLTSTTRVRARTFAPGALPSATVTEVFTFVEDSSAGFASNLPLVIINPFRQYISQDNRVTVTARFIDPDKQGRSTLLGPASFDGSASVNIRGHSTADQPKYSLTVRLVDDNGDKTKARLFGMPADSDWVLYAPFSDKTLIRDALAYELSNAMGRYAPRTRFVEVFLDRSGGKLSQRDYMGVYVLVERIKRSKDRVDLVELSASQTTEPEITGGFILKRDHSNRYEQGFRTSEGNHFNYVEPDPEDMSREQMNWIASYMRRFEQALNGPDFRDPARGYAAYLDVDAFIDQHWLVEMSKNIDGFRYSAYVHKDRNGKLKAGPAWDWNLSFGNANYYDGSDPTGWYTEVLRDSEICWFRRLSEDPEFMQRAIDRWGELRAGVFSTRRILARVDEMAAQLKEAQARNFRRWPIMGRRVHPNDFVGDTYEEEINWMKTWIQKRLSWMDGRFVEVPSVAQSNGTVSIRAGSGKVYYTLDGSDPRLPGGGVSPKAQVYREPISLKAGQRLLARAQHRSGWSAPATLGATESAAAKR